MNLFHQKLYDDLMRLCQNNEAFFFTDQIIASITYRIFNYRLASYTDWLAPHALECRGITFIVEGEGYTAVPKFLASWPFEKFFNLHEVTTDINTLAEALIARGELSREVYERAKRKN
jgi:T4 RnlA family RNA ligase